MEQLIRLEPEVESAREARRFVGRALQGWNGPQLRDHAVLLANELVVNAIRHARTPLEVRVSIEPDNVEVGVRDASLVIPERQDPLPDEDHGRGLLTVDNLAADWGVERDAEGKTVWFRLVPESR
jgi:anti-sigma regulatory factor (Ser/Thr protein kinase)